MGRYGVTDEDLEKIITQVVWLAKNKQLAGWGYGHYDLLDKAGALEAMVRAAATNGWAWNEYPPKMMQVAREAAAKIAAVNPGRDVLGEKEKHSFLGCFDIFKEQLELYLLELADDRRKERQAAQRLADQPFYDHLELRTAQNGELEIREFPSEIFAQKKTVSIDGKDVPLEALVAALQQLAGTHLGASKVQAGITQRHITGDRGRAVEGP